MTPDNLRTLSWRAFKATFVCGVLGVLLLLAAPNPGFAASQSTAARVIAMLGFGLIGLALLANLVSLVMGAMAWKQGAGRCYWIIFCALLVLTPVALSL